MRREIKFRGLSPLGKWFYGVPCKSNYGVSLITEIYHVDGAEYNVWEEDVNPETIGEFTGLKDKNGKEIYEGDIICYEKIKGSWGFRVVSFEKGMFGFRDKANVWCALGIRQGNKPDNKHYEVIGNIFENPELLNQ